MVARDSNLLRHQRHLQGEPMSIPTQEQSQQTYVSHVVATDIGDTNAQKKDEGTTVPGNNTNKDKCSLLDSLRDLN